VRKHRRQRCTAIPQPSERRTTVPPHPGFAQTLIASPGGPETRRRPDVCIVIPLSSNRMNTTLKKLGSPRIAIVEQTALEVGDLMT
jgi:hypothetical protein